MIYILNKEKFELKPEFYKKHLTDLLFADPHTIASVGSLKVLAERVTKFKASLERLSENYFFVVNEANGILTSAVQFDYLVNKNWLISHPSASPFSRVNETPILKEEIMLGLEQIKNSPQQVKRVQVVATHKPGIYGFVNGLYNFRTVKDPLLPKGYAEEHSAFTVLEDPVTFIKKAAPGHSFEELYGSDKLKPSAKEKK